MRIQLLDNITGKWAMQWIVIWFICGVIALSAGFWLTTDHTTLDWFYLAVSFIGLVCVVSLSFRKNVMGNGFGMGATAGEVIVQATSGAVGLMLAPLFNFFTHVYGIFYWSKHTDPDGDMIPKSASKAVWINVIAFVLSITAQAAMILRYSFNWWLWIIVNFVWLIVNLMSGNYIFAIQTMVYQVNAFVGLYEWHRSERG